MKEQDVKQQEQAEVCEEYEVHAEIVHQVEEMMPPEEQLYDLAELFKVFVDSTRIKILFVLAKCDMCVCDIAQLLNMTQSAISHQLRVLKQNRLVRYKREGKSIIYSLSDNHVKTILQMGMEHILE